MERLVASIPLWGELCRMLIASIESSFLSN
jgi:hypothetical protein